MLVKLFKPRHLAIALLGCSLSAIEGVSVSEQGVAVSLINTAVAEEKKKLTKAEKESKLKYKQGITRKRQAVGQQCAKKLEKVQELTSSDDGKTPNFAAAETELKGALKRGCKEGFEHSEVNRFLGYVLYSQDKYPEAIAAYMAVVNEPKADEQKRTNTRYTAAQLMFVSEDYAGAIVQLEAWLKEVAVVDKSGKVLLARAYHQTGRKDDALALVEEVIAEAAAEGIAPRESWLNFQWVLYYERENFKKAVEVNRVTLTHYPKLKYWKQISAMFSALEESEKEAITLDLLRMQNGLDKENQFLALARQFMALDIPYRGAEVLKNAMDDGVVERTERNLEILGAAYQRAQEFKKASPILEEAAKLSDNGNAYSRLASVYLNLNQNEKALIAARNALKKGKLKREDLAWMYRGNAETALHCYKAASKSFSRASKFERSKKNATNWNTYVSREGERRSKLIANGAPLAGCKKV